MVKLLLPAAYKVRQEVIFSVCQFTPGGGGGTPVPGSFPGHWSQVLSWGGTPVLVGGGVLPQPGLGYPPTPQPSQDRTAEQTLVTQRALCLLRSRRRTFLLTKKLGVMAKNRRAKLQESLNLGQGPGKIKRIQISSIRCNQLTVHMINVVIMEVYAYPCPILWYPSGQPHRNPWEVGVHPKLHGAPPHPDPPTPMHV